MSTPIYKKSYYFFLSSAVHFFWPWTVEKSLSCPQARHKSKPRQGHPCQPTDVLVLVRNTVSAGGVFEALTHITGGIGDAVGSAAG